MIEKQKEIINLISNNFQNKNINNSDLVQNFELLKLNPFLLKFC